MGPVGGFEQSLGDQPGQDQSQGLVGDVHLGGNLTSLAEAGPVVASDRDHGSNGVVAFSFEAQLHSCSQQNLAPTYSFPIEFQSQLRIQEMC